MIIGTKRSQRVIALCMLALTGAGNPVNAAELHVPADHATIQAAVNAAASGDTIHIAPGVYVEQTFITNKNLTLIGQPGTILRAVPGMQPGLPGVVDWGCIIFIAESSNVVVRNLTFEGGSTGGSKQCWHQGRQFRCVGRGCGKPPVHRLL